MWIEDMSKLMVHRKLTGYKMEGNTPKLTHPPLSTYTHTQQRPAALLLTSALSRITDVYSTRPPTPTPDLDNCSTARHWKKNSLHSLANAMTKKYGERGLEK